MGLLLSLGKWVLTNRWALVAIAATLAFGAGWAKGCSYERAADVSRHAQEAQQAAVEAAQTAVVQAELEVSHDKRVRKILSHDVPDADAARMLSKWPDEAPPVGAP